MKQRALRKLNTELNKDIVNLIKLCEQATFIELSFLIMLIHFNRLGNKYPEYINPENPNLVQFMSSQVEETLKYLIQCIVKYGKKGVYKEKTSGLPVLNKDLLRVLIGSGNIINAKYETKALVELFDVEVGGERDRYFKIDTGKIEPDSDVAKMFDYFVRIEIDNKIKKALWDFAGYPPHLVV